MIVYVIFDSARYVYGATTDLKVARQMANDVRVEVGRCTEIVETEMYETVDAFRGSGEGR